MYENKDDKKKYLSSLIKVTLFILLVLRYLQYIQKFIVFIFDIYNSCNYMKHQVAYFRKAACLRTCSPYLSSDVFVCFCGYALIYTFIDRFTNTQIPKDPWLDVHLHWLICHCKMSSFWAVDKHPIYHCLIICSAWERGRCPPPASPV